MNKVQEDLRYELAIDIVKILSKAADEGCLEECLEVLHILVQPAYDKR